MKHYEATFDRSRRHPVDVWAVLADAAVWPSWDSGVDGGRGPDRRRREGHHPLGGVARRAFPVTVTTLEPPHRLVFTGGMPLGLFRGVRTYTLTPDGARDAVPDAGGVHRSAARADLALDAGPAALVRPVRRRARSGASSRVPDAGRSRRSLRGARRPEPAGDPQPARRRATGRCGEIADALPISRPAVSRHLRLLKEAGLVAEEPHGTRRIYRLQEEGLAAVQRLPGAGVGRGRRPVPAGGGEHGETPGRDRAAALRASTSPARSSTPSRVWTAGIGTWWPADHTVTGERGLRVVLEGRAWAAGSSSGRPTGPSTTGAR